MFSLKKAISSFFFTHLKKTLFPFRKERGTTLVEILVAMTIFGVITLGIAEFFRSTETSKRKLYVKRVMESLSQELYHKISSPFSVYLSLQGGRNSDLVSCVEDVSSCSATSSEKALGFSLAYENTSAGISYVAGPLVESDWESDSVCYDTNGSSCNCNENFSSGGASCVFIAETYFYVGCGEEGGVCDKGASSIHLSYRVRQKEGSLTRLGREMQALPRREFFVHHPLESVFNPRFNSECNTGAVVTGFAKSGRAICECASEYVSTGVENKRGPLCEKASDRVFECPENTVPAGLTENHTMKCIPFEEAYECIETRGDEVQDNICLEGYWLQKYYRKTCQFHCSVDSWDGRECQNTEENSFDEKGRKVGIWCYDESPFDEGVEDIKICCRRLFEGF